MNEFVCAGCRTFFAPAVPACPHCGSQLIYEGENKNVIDRLEPDCLIHRYDGSDLLEPAVVIKECKTNIKVAAKLRDFARPLTVPKHKVYAFNPNVLSSIQALRNERTATIMRYDKLIQSHWQKLKPYGRYDKQ